MASATLVRDRTTGQIFEERIFGGRALQYLYGGARSRWLTHHFLATATANRIYGLLQRAPRSRRKIPKFVSTLGVDVTEAELPLERYVSLDAFFTRRLRPGARPIDATPEHFCAPADGRVLVFPRIEVGCLRVKGAEVTVDELLGGTETERYRDGAAMVVRLAPADYHRFHFPDAGEAGPSRAIGGRLHSVHPIALAAGAPSLRNKRSVTLLATARFGTIALIEVGALCVGTIVQTYRPGRVARGDEKGYFRFGGSTIVVLAEPGRLHFDEDLERASADGVETLVRVGSRVGRAGA